MTEKVSEALSAAPSLFEPFHYLELRELVKTVKGLSPRQILAIRTLMCKHRPDLESTPTGTTGVYPPELRFFSRYGPHPCASAALTRDLSVCHVVTQRMIQILAQRCASLREEDVLDGQVKVSELLAPARSHTAVSAVPQLCAFLVPPGAASEIFRGSAGGAGSMSGVEGRGSQGNNNNDSKAPELQMRDLTLGSEGGAGTGANGMQAGPSDGAASNP
ncbi:MAG: hypothetical protein WDW38_002092 [Sanguina aurantia]